MLTPKSIAIIGVCVAIAIFFIIAEISVMGLCFLGMCDTEIEIISTHYPSPVIYDQPFLTKFTVSYTGENTANNCILHFAPHDRIIDEILSEPFSIGTDEKVKIFLEFSGFGRDDQRVNVIESDLERTMTAWVVCDGLESHRVHLKTFLDYRTLGQMLRGEPSGNP